jgi:hypothetical protein
MIELPERPLSYDDVRRILLAVIEERGGLDFVYHGLGPDEVFGDQPENSEYRQKPATWSSCVNFDKDGKPSCVVGHLVDVVLGNEDELRAWFRDPDHRMIAANQAYDELVDAGVLERDGRTFHLLCTIQEMQDTGNTWGSAYESALLQANEYDKDGAYTA